VSSAATTTRRSRTATTPCGALRDDRRGPGCLDASSLRSSAPGLGLRWAVQLLAILLPVAASSYCDAVLVTGNPLFPFINAVFRSPYYPLENMRDLKWMAGVTWRAPWDLLFRSEAFGQYYAGASGITVLATLPLVLLAAVRKPEMRWLAAWALLLAALLFWQMQYLRYLFPAYAVLAVLGVVALSRMLHWRGFVAAMLGLVAVDVAMVPDTSWNVRPNPWAGFLRLGPGLQGQVGGDGLHKVAGRLAKIGLEPLGRRRPRCQNGEPVLGDLGAAQPA